MNPTNKISFPPYRMLGAGSYGGKTAGLIKLLNWGCKVPPFVTLRAGFLGERLKGERGLNVSRQDISVINENLNSIGFRKGPLAVRSDNPYESCGAEEIQTSPAGLLDTRIFFYDPADPVRVEELLTNIEKVVASSRSKDFEAFLLKHGLTPLPSSVILQPFIYTLNPIRKDGFYPYYSAVIDTVHPLQVRVCAGFGAGTFNISVRGQGFVHRFSRDGLEHRPHARSGRQMCFEMLTLGGLVRSDMSEALSYPQLQEARGVLSSRDRFLSPAQIAHNISLQYPPGTGICLEIASQEPNSEPGFLQLNPIKQMQAEYDRPEIGEENILFETNNVIGQAHKKITRTIMVILPGAKEESMNIMSALEKLNHDNSDFLLVIPGQLTSQGLGTAMPYRCFCNAGTVLEYGSGVHETGSGMDHFTRICTTGNIPYLESDYESIKDLVAHLSRWLPFLSSSLKPGVHLFETAGLQVWVNEEAGEGRGEGIIFQRPPLMPEL